MLPNQMVTCGASTWIRLRNCDGFRPQLAPEEEATFEPSGKPVKLRQFPPVPFYGAHSVHSYANDRRVISRTSTRVWI